MLLLFDGDNATCDTLLFAEEALGFGLWRMSLPDARMAWSTNAQRLLGQESDPAKLAAPVSTFADFESTAHPEDLPVLLEIQHLLAKGLPFNRQFRVIHPNGRVRVVIMCGETMLNAVGKAERAIGAIIDVTDHAEQIRTVNIAAERVRGLIQGLDARLWVARPDGYITDYPFNEANKDLRVGNNWRALVHPDDRDANVAAWERAIATKSSYHAEYRSREADGAYHWRRGMAVPLRDDDGSVHEWIGISIHLDRKVENGSVLPTGAQVRAGRGLMGWSVRTLATRSGVSDGAIRRIEERDGISTAAAAALIKLKDALSAGGVEFFTLPSGEAGVYPARREGRLRLAAEGATNTKKRFFAC